MKLLLRLNVFVSKLVYAIGIVGVLAAPTVASGLTASEKRIEAFKQSRKVTVNTQTAELCFADTKDCHPVLIGESTPKGLYPLTLMATDKKGYGGEIIGFKEEEGMVYALHRVWNGRPHEKRAERIATGSISDRILTKGCINVSNDVYERLRKYFYVEIV